MEVNMKKLKLVWVLLISYATMTQIVAKPASPQEIFFKAIEDNDPLRVKKAMQVQGVDINAINPKTGKTALATTLVRIFDYSSTHWFWLLPLLVTLNTSLAGSGALIGSVASGVGYAIMGSSKERGTVGDLKKEIMRSHWKKTPEEVRSRLKNDALAGLIVSLVAATLVTTFGSLTHKMRTRLENAQKIAYFLLTNSEIKVDKATEKLRLQVFPDYEMDIIAFKIKELKH